MKPPDLKNTPRFVSEDIVQLIYSRENRFRAVITRDIRGIFHVRCQKWSGGGYEGCWIPYDTGSTLTDTPVIARKLAIEKLVGSPAGYAQSSTSGMTSEEVL